MLALRDIEISPAEKASACDWLSRQIIERIFRRGAASHLPAQEHLTIPDGSALLHITHWKAGSQWIRGMLEEAFGGAIEPPVAHSAHFFDKPIRPGRVYPCLYLNRYEFDSVSPAGRCAPFVIIRDLRDTLVSAYFSWRFSHSLEWYPAQKSRRVLNALSVEAGLHYMLHEFLPKPALIQNTWLQSDTKCWRLEDFTRDPPGQLRDLLQHLGVPAERRYIEALTERHSFKRLSGGRRAGDENVASHYRKGVVGDWRQHFTPELKAQFKHFYNDLLIRAGYEQDDNW